MIPYRPTPTFITVKSKQPSIPSLELVNTLTTVVEQSQSNSYDPKNHVLTINDLPSFELSLHAKFGRSFRLFEKQLRFLGWKLRKYKADSDNDVRVYKWKGKKQALIDGQLSAIETGLKQRKLELQITRNQIRQFRKGIDTKIESLLFSLLISTNIPQSSSQLNQLLRQTKQGVNSTQLVIQKIIKKMSITLGNELELYKLLIYKEGASSKKVQQDRYQFADDGEEFGDDGEGEGEGEGDGDGEGERNGDVEGGNSVDNGVIEEEGSRNSLVSIEMEQNEKKKSEEHQEIKSEMM